MSATHRVSPIMSSGNHETKAKYATRFCRRTAQATLFRLSLLIFAVSLLYGESAVAQIAAILFLIAAIVSALAIWRGLSLTPADERPCVLLRRSRLHEVVDT